MENKVLKDLCGIPVVARTALAFGLFADTVTIVGREEELDTLREALASAGDVLDRCRFVDGGATRQDSVRNGLLSLHREPPYSIVLVHDAARPLVSPAIVQACIASAVEFGSGVAALPVNDTLKRADYDGVVSGTLDREGAWAMQTPQGFRLDLLREASEAATRSGFQGTDEVSIVERLGTHRIHLVRGARENIKITTPEDLEFAERWLQSPPSPDVRVGTGYDIHRLVEGRDLFLGGIKIENDYGLLGHSDADVLLHAICDSLLGAAGLPDIGNLYPNTDARWSGVASTVFLADVANRLAGDGWRVMNVDATLIAERPKIAPYTRAMITKIADVLAIDPARVNVKATTQEGIGSLGAGQGMACHATACICR